MNKKDLANCIRFLSIDAIEKAGSGHPGMPMGMADVATVLFTEFLNFNANDPKWLNRDRFILSAGHGSMLLYSLLYLTGYQDINLEEIKNFRQLHSKCAGHPEYGELAGIETTTGPLGQGIANAVGMAISEKMLKARFGEEIFNHKIYCLVGDGCLMEGISQEALSLAGHLKLNNLVVIWDNNSISIDGKTSITTSENINLRFEALGFKVISIDGHDFSQISDAFTNAQKSTTPIFINCKTIIGYGSPNKAGSEKIHGSALGEQETKKTRENLGWNYNNFEIPNNLLDQWRLASKRSQDLYQKWQNNFNKLPENKKTELLQIINKDFSKNFNQKIKEFKDKIISDKITQASRKSSQQVLEFITGEIASLIGGSADLTESVLTKTTHTASITSNNFQGRYIHYGVREHAMSAIMNGISLHGNFIPYGGTFLVFSDYLKPALRLSALMKQQILYVFTHDSIGLGEDGPTHQPIEHLAMLRSIPNLNVFRPADSEETLACYELALENKNSPSALVFSRQNLKFINKHCQDYKKGAYVVIDCDNPQTIIIATGSELQIAIEANQILKNHNINSRVISMPSFEIFNKQDDVYKNKILGDNKILKCAVEAGVRQGWDQFINKEGIFIGMNSFGASAKCEDLYKNFQINSQNLVDQILKKINNFAQDNH